MCRSILKATLLAIVLLGLSTALMAQQTGSIVGTVADKTGAMIVNAKVTLTNTATKDIRHTTTNSEGFFVFSGSVVGDYSVKAEMDGFQAAELSGIHLSPGDRRNLNVTLAVRAAEQSVTVEAEASGIQVVDSGDLSSTIFAKDLARNALQGRDATELLKTLPGFSNNNGLRNKNGYDTTITSIQSALGNAITAPGVPSRVGGADLVSDGAHILDAGCGCNALQTVNADMVSELKVTTSAYGADNMTGPVVVSAVSKSGSSEYHGAAYLHFRDSALNSNDWIFNRKEVARPNDRYWYPGGQFGGPVPFTNKKLTFFSSYEYYNQAFPEQTSGGLLQALVPTLSERAGLFDPTLADNAAVCSSIQGWVSGQYRCQPFTLIDTASGYVDGITNSDVSAYIGPGAQAMLKLIPEPNRTPTPQSAINYVQPLINTNNGYMFHTRVDYAFNDSTKLYIGYNQQHQLYGRPMTRWWVPADSIANVGDPSSSDSSKTLSGNLVKVFNPTTTNEFLASISFLRPQSSLGNEKAVDKAAQGYPYMYPGVNIMPSIMNSWWTTDMGIPQLLDTGSYAYYERKLQPSISDNFTKVLKTHTLKFGVSWLRSGNQGTNIDQGTGPNGTAAYGPIWDFNGPDGSQITSAYNPVLDFMLDYPSGFSYRPITKADMKTSSWGFYGQDDWKVTRRLSVNFGLRLSHDSPWEDATGKFGVPAWTRAWYDADLADGITKLPGMRWHAIDKSVPLSGHTIDSMFYAPRFGISYDLFGTGKTVFRGGFGTYYYPDPLQGSAGTGLSMGGTSCSTRSSTFLAKIEADPDNTMACADSIGGLTDGTANDPNDHSEPVTYTYNFTVSQELPLRSVLELTYRGSKSDNLIGEGLKDINRIPIGAFMQPDPNPESSNFGQVMPIDQIKDNVLQDYFPLTHYKAMNLIRHNAWANYNALQVAWTKQRGALAFNLNYTWSKNLGIGATPDPINIHNDYGLVGQDRTHVFNASYSYEVGNRFKSKFGAVLLNGWLISGITNLQSGPPVQQSWSPNLSLNGSNELASNNSVSNKNYLGTTSYTLMPVLTCNPSQGLKGGQYINPNCFSLPAAPQFDENGVLIQLGGQGQYQWPYLRGPAYFNSDLSVARTIRITERQNVQIKFAAFNFLNHPLKSFNPDNSSNIALNYNTGVLNTQGDGWVYGVPNEKFGRRVLEMTLRYNF